MPTTDATPADLHTPEGLLATYAALAAAGDHAALLALYEPEGAFEPDDGTVLVGHDAIGPALVELCSLRPEIAYVGAPAVIEVGDVALVSTEWTMRAAAPDGTEVRQGGRSADVLRRRPDGTWRVLVDQPRGATMAP